MGTKLRIARRRFQLIIVARIKPRIPDVSIFIKLWPEKNTWVTILARTAKAIFVIGPASETSAKSLSPSRRLNGSTGTGFAPPKIKVPPEPK